MNKKETLDVVKETAEKLDIDPVPSVMTAFMGGSPESITNIMVAQSNKKRTGEAKEENPKPEGKPVDYTEEESLLHDMLQENTGIHIMDSGGKNGRLWQRNRKITDFRVEHPVSANIYSLDDFYFSVDTFSYLANQLVRDEECEKLEDAFYRWAEEQSGSYMGLLQSWQPYEQSSMYWKNADATENTYNHETTVGTFQYTPFIYPDEEFAYYNECIIALCIHTGADVRGGYTNPRFFRVEDLASFILRASDMCADCGCTRGTGESAGYYWSWKVEKISTPPEVQKTLEGEILPSKLNELVGYNTIPNDKLPPYWELIPIEEVEDPGQYTGDYVPRCKRCGDIPTFSSPGMW